MLLSKLFLLKQTITSGFITLKNTTNNAITLSCTGYDNVVIPAGETGWINSKPYEPVYVNGGETVYCCAYRHKENYATPTSSNITIESKSDSYTYYGYQVDRSEDGWGSVSQSYPKTESLSSISSLISLCYRDFDSPYPCVLAFPTTTTKRIYTNLLEDERPSLEFTHDNGSYYAWQSLDNKYVSCYFYTTSKNPTTSDKVYTVINGVLRECPVTIASVESTTISLKLSTDWTLDVARIPLANINVPEDPKVFSFALRNPDENGVGFTFDNTYSGTGNGVVSPITINWGDGNTETVAVGAKSVTHTYDSMSTTNTYVVEMTTEDNKMSWFRPVEATMAPSIYKIFTPLPKLYLGSTDTESTTIQYFFCGCSNIKSIPEDFFKYNTQITDFSGCFSKMNGVVPDSIFKHTTTISNCESMFNTYEGTKIPSSLLNAEVTADSCFHMFQDSKIQSIPTGLFDKFTNVTKFDSCFAGCKSTWFTKVPEKLFKYCTKATDFESLFDGCLYLEEVPDDIFSYTTTFGEWASERLELNRAFYETSIGGYSWNRTDIVSILNNINPNIKQNYPVECQYFACNTKLTFIDNTLPTVLSGFKNIDLSFGFVYNANIEGTLPDVSGIATATCAFIYAGASKATNYKSIPMSYGGPIPITVNTNPSNVNANITFTEDANALAILLARPSSVGFAEGNVFYGTLGIPVTCKAIAKGYEEASEVITPDGNQESYTVTLTLKERSNDVIISANSNLSKELSITSNGTTETLAVGNSITLSNHKKGSTVHIASAGGGDYSDTGTVINYVTNYGSTLDVNSTLISPSASHTLIVESDDATDELSFTALDTYVDTWGDGTTETRTITQTGKGSINYTFSGGDEYGRPPSDTFSNILLTITNGTTVTKMTLDLTTASNTVWYFRVTNDGVDYTIGSSGTGGDGDIGGSTGREDTGAY